MIVGCRVRALVEEYVGVEELKRVGVAVELAFEEPGNEGPVEEMDVGLEDLLVGERFIER
jgi:hypothetical protein